MSEKEMLVRFWGTGGSLPSPLDAAGVQDKIVTAIMATKLDEDFDEVLAGGREAVRHWLSRNINVPFSTSGTYGGETTCVELRYGNIVIVIDMGSGFRKFGNSIIGEIFGKKLSKIHVLMSHVHWDHIQGFPFFAPIYLSRKDVTFLMDFYGGTSWQGTLDDALKNQMDGPVFPIEWGKIKKEGPSFNFNDVSDKFSQTFLDENTRDTVKVYCRRLNHPNETYGWRIECRSEGSDAVKVFTFSSDTEPYRGPHAPLIEIAKETDLLYLDVQYTENQYTGREGGVPRQGWGHGFDSYAAEVMLDSGARKLLTGHHDPGSNDERIEQIAENIRKMLGDPRAFQESILPAYDGMVIKI